MRLIDGDALKRKAQKVAEEAWKMNIKARIETILNQFIDWLEDAPAIDTVRKGKWIKISPAEIYECSVCGLNLMTGDIDVYSWCHGCGAKMEKGD